MKKLKILNSKEKKKLFEKINNYYGSSFSTKQVILQDEKGKIFIISKELAQIDFDQLRIEKVGLFFGQIIDKEIILSVEGSQMLDKISKNFIELNNQEFKEYLFGESILTENKNGIYIIKSNNNVLGSTKLRNGKILNALPKNRRIGSI